MNPIKKAKLSALSQIFFAIGDSSFLGISIAALVAENLFMSRIVLVGIGMLLAITSFLLFYFFETNQID